MAVTHFNRETGFSNDILHPFSNEFPVRRIRQNYPITYFRKECLPERKHLVKIENSGYPNLWGMGWKFFLSFVGSGEHLLSFFKEVRNVRSFCSFNDIVFLTSTSVKEGLFSFDTHLSNEAQIGTTFAFKRCLFITALTQVEPFEARSLPYPLFHGQNSDTDGPCHIMILRNDDLFLQNLLKGSYDSFIECRPALEKDQ